MPRFRGLVPVTDRLQRLEPCPCPYLQHFFQLARLVKKIMVHARLEVKKNSFGTETCAEQPLIINDRWLIAEGMNYYLLHTDFWSFITVNRENRGFN